MNARLVRSWLLSRPRPASLKLKSQDAYNELPIEDSPNWAKLAESIETMDPDSIEAYDKDGKLLRAQKSDFFEDESDDPVVAREKAKLDAETERFRCYSDHLAQAYRFATEVAFERMVDLFAAVNRRSEALEKSLDATHRLLGKAYQEQVDTALEQATSGDPLDNIVGAFVQGAAQGRIDSAMKTASSPSKKNGSNGKGEQQI
jgi:hypothetical protein